MRLSHGLGGAGGRPPVESAARLHRHGPTHTTWIDFFFWRKVGNNRTEGFEAFGRRGRVRPQVLLSVDGRACCQRLFLRCNTVLHARRTPNHCSTVTSFYLGSGSEISLPLDFIILFCKTYCESHAKHLGVVRMIPGEQLLPMSAGRVPPRKAATYDGKLVLSRSGPTLSAAECPRWHGVRDALSTAVHERT